MNKPTIQHNIIKHNTISISYYIALYHTIAYHSLSYPYHIYIYIYSGIIWHHFVTSRDCFSLVSFFISLVNILSTSAKKIFIRTPQNQHWWHHQSTAPPAPAGSIEQRSPIRHRRHAAEPGHLWSPCLTRNMANMPSMEVVSWVVYYPYFWCYIWLLNMGIYIYSSILPNPNWRLYVWVYHTKKNPLLQM